MCLCLTLSVRTTRTNHNYQIPFHRALLQLLFSQTIHMPSIVLFQVQNPFWLWPSCEYGEGKGDGWFIQAQMVAKFSLKRWCHVFEDIPLGMDL